MMISSLRGVFITNNILIIRYLLIFGALVILPIIFNKISITKEQLIKIGNNIVNSSLIYTILYLLHGINLNLVGYDQFEKQGIEWVGSSSAFFPCVLGYIVQLIF